MTKLRNLPLWGPVVDNDITGMKLWQLKKVVIAARKIPTMTDGDLFDLTVSMISECAFWSSRGRIGPIECEAVCTMLYNESEHRAGHVSPDEPGYENVDHGEPTIYNRAHKRAVADHT